MILGLDISTTCTGITVLDHHGKLAIIEAVQISKLPNIYAKAQAVVNRLQELIKLNYWLYTNIYIEQPLGYSNNAKTVVALCQFNGLLSGMLFSTFNIQPQHFTINEIRKAFLPEYISTKGALSIPKELDKKMVVFDKVNSIYPALNWDYKRTGKLQDWCLDATDSFAVAYTGWLAINK